MSKRQQEAFDVVALEEMLVARLNDMGPAFAANDPVQAQALLDEFVSVVRVQPGWAKAWRCQSCRRLWVTRASITPTVCPTCQAPVSPC
jgi:hypothetical protein